MRRWLLLICVVLVAGTASAQNLKQCLKYGDESMDKGDYYGAILLYEKAMAFDSASIDINFKYAEALRLYNNYPKAAYYYQKVLKKGSGKIHPESVFWLATMEKQQGFYRESAKTWKKVKRAFGRDRKGYYALKAKQETKACSWANKMRKKMTDWSVRSSEVNTFDSEFAPFQHNELLYFSSMRAEQLGEESTVLDDDYRIQIYSADTTSDDIAALDTIINSLQSSNGEASFSPDGNRIYFTRCPEGQPCQIYISRKKGDSWSMPEKVGKINDNGASSVQPFVTNVDGKEIIFFSSTMDGGYGGLDIWYSTVTKDGNNYSKPKNLGKAINTLDDEVSPYYDATAGRLYFSSSWHVGYGGQDVFSTAGKPGGKFGVPKNMGLPINSAANDMYFKLSGEGTGYFTSNRIGSKSKPHSTCCNDIFIAELPKEPVDTVPYKSLKELNDFLPVTLYFHNDRPNPNSTDTFTNLNYMTTYDRYHARIDEYKREFTKGMGEGKAEEAKNEIEDFFFDKVDKGVADLEIFTELLLEELEKGQKIEVTVQGFASPLAKTKYNVYLTSRRISSMINYLSEYHGGVIKPYIDGTAENGGSLAFIQNRFGEYDADQQISDDRLNKKESVYSVKASLERKIEIQSVQIASAKDSSYAEIHLDVEVFDFGVTDKLDTLTHVFTYENTGSEPLHIDSVDLHCECLNVEYDDVVLQPGETSTIYVEFDPSEKRGKTRVHFMVFTNGFPKEKELSLTIDVVGHD